MKSLQQTIYYFGIKLLHAHLYDQIYMKECVGHGCRTTLLTPSFGNCLFEYLVLRHLQQNMILSSFCIKIQSPKTILTMYFECTREVIQVLNQNSSKFWDFRQAFGTFSICCWFEGKFSNCIFSGKIVTSLAYIFTMEKSLCQDYFHP